MFIKFCLKEQNCISIFTFTWKFLFWCESCLEEMSRYILRNCACIFNLVKLMWMHIQHKNLFGLDHKINWLFSKAGHVNPLHHCSLYVLVIRLLNHGEDWISSLWISSWHFLITPFLSASHMRTFPHSPIPGWIEANNFLFQDSFDILKVSSLSHSTASAWGCLCGPLQQLQIRAKLMQIQVV